jgi:Na+/H+-translocating membrane pyrophosphatase
VLDAGVVEAVTNTIQEAYDAGRGVFTTVTATPADLLGMNLIELNIPAALRRDAARTAEAAPDNVPTSIGLDLLAVVLARETSVWIRSTSMPRWP